LPRYLVLYNYQHGGFGFIAYASSKKELEHALGVGKPDQGITVIDSNIDEHSLVKALGSRIKVYDLRCPEGLLLSIMQH